MPTGAEGSHIIDGLTVRGGGLLVGPSTDTGGQTKTVPFDVEYLGHSARQYALNKTARNVFAETFPAHQQTAGAVLTSGTVNYTAIWLWAGETVTNFDYIVTVAGATSPGLNKIGIYTPTAGSSVNYTLQGATADQAAVWTTAGVYRTALTTAYTVTAATQGIHYIANLSIFTTPATFSASTAAGVAFVKRQVNAANFALVASLAGQTDLTATVTGVSITNTAQSIYTALS